MKEPLGEAQGRSRCSWPERVLVCFILGLLAAIALAPISLASNGNDIMMAQDATEDDLIHTHVITLVGYPTLTRITICGGENIQVDVIDEGQKPAEVEEPTLLVQSYISLEASGSIENAKIQFRVSRDWLEQNSVDENSVRLLRFNGEWQELPTKLDNITDFYMYYEAESPGFSVFAVAGQSAGAPVSLGFPLGFYAVLSIVGVAGGVSAFYWFRMRPMKPFVSLPRLKRRVMGGKPRRAKVGEPEMATTIRRLKHATKLKPAIEPSIKKLKRPSRPKAIKTLGEDVELLKRLKRKMEREK